MIPQTTVNKNIIIFINNMFCGNILKKSMLKALSRCKLELINIELR